MPKEEIAFEKIGSDCCEKFNSMLGSREGRRYNFTYETALEITQKYLGLI